MDFFNDEYTLEIDTLGYKKQADQVRRLILDAQTPFSIGLSGRWGSGKTSLMKYLMASLGGEPLKHRLKYQTDTIKEKGAFKEVALKYKDDVKHVQSIWFNPWEYEDHSEPLVGLLQEIQDHFSMISKGYGTAKKLSAVSIQAGLDMLGSLFKVGKNQASHIKSIGEGYEYDTFQHIERSQRFKLIFQEAITKLLTQKKRKTLDKTARLVIFIDDLDRCEEETIAKLLKEIKQYLSTDRCVFVFGALPPIERVKIKR